MARTGRGGYPAMVAEMAPGQLLAVAAVVAAVLFGLAGVIGALGYLVAVSRSR